MNIQHFTNADDLKAHYAKLFKRPSAPIVPRARVNPTTAWLTGNARPVPPVCFDIPWYWEDISSFPTRKRIKAVKLRVADQFGVTVEAMESASRIKKISIARFNGYAAMFREFRGEPNWSLDRIGKEFNKDHTTVLYGLRKAGVWGK